MASVGNGQDKIEGTAALGHSVRLVDRIITLASTWMAYGSSVLLFVMMVSIFFDAIGRWLYGTGIPGTFDFTHVFMASVVFLGLSYAEAKGHHIRATIFVRLMPPWLAKAVNIFAHCLGVVYFAVIAVQGTIILIESLAMLEYLPGIVKVPVYPARLLLVLGSGFMCFIILCKLVKTFRGVAVTEEEKDID